MVKRPTQAFSEQVSLPHFRSVVVWLFTQRFSRRFLLSRRNTLPIMWDPSLMEVFVTPTNQVVSPARVQVAFNGRPVAVAVRPDQKTAAVLVEGG